MYREDVHSTVCVAYSDHAFNAQFKSDIIINPKNGCFFVLGIGNGDDFTTPFDIVPHFVGDVAVYFGNPIGDLGASQCPHREAEVVIVFIAAECAYHIEGMSIEKSHFVQKVDVVHFIPGRFRSMGREDNMLPKRFQGLIMPVSYLQDQKHQLLQRQCFHLPFQPNLQAPWYQRKL